MPFKLGDTETARKGGQAAMKARRSQLDMLFKTLETGLAGKYEELMQMQAEGETINKAQREFMTRYERNMEYLAPKRSRVDSVTVTLSPLELKGKTDAELAQLLEE